MAKRPNNTGNIRQRKDGLWEGRYIAGWDYSKGDYVRKSIYGKTQKEVSKKLTAIIAEQDENGIYLEPSSITLEAWMDIYLKDHCTTVKPSSLALYKRMSKNYIAPHIGNVKLKELKREHIIHLFNTLSQTISPHTVKDTRGLLHKALEEAVLSKLLKENPCQHIPIKKVEKPDITLLNKEHIRPFLDACGQDDLYGNCLALLLYTGCRESEMLGLPWRNVDFENGVITISQQLENRTYDITTTKTGKERTFKPATVVMDILSAVKLQQDKHKAVMGKAWMNDADLVFTTPQGDHLYHNTLRKHLHRIAEAIGLPGLRVHDLRHSYSVLAVLAGEDVKSIQSVLGHSTITTTMDIYSRFSKDLQQASSDRMSDFFSRF